jgi:DNA repair protein RadA/Sms
MAKTKTVFFCKNCGNESAKWIGKCPGCGEWNTYVEETVVTGKKAQTISNSIVMPGSAKPLPVQEISSTKIDRMDMG